MTDTRLRLFREEDWDEVVALEERAYAASGLSGQDERVRDSASVQKTRWRTGIRGRRAVP